MGPTLAAILGSELGSWFGVHEVARNPLPAGGQEVRLEPGGYSMPSTSPCRWTARNS